MLASITHQRPVSDPPYSNGFVRGAKVETQNGSKAIEDIAAGDLVLTLDNGAQPVRFVQRQTVEACEQFSPVLFEAGSIGNSNEVLVSPEHRMLIADWRAELLMGCDEVLVAAKHLVNGKDVRTVVGGAVDYIHLLFAAHQIIFVNGCATESCLPNNCWTPTEITHGAKGAASILVARPVVRSAEAACLMAA
ncbi:Hint domain-containing protein [uncultured Sulfitobacter sp.]|uniref:Hint domain-containing protein n=1 Tax=uncultured Sulfitobacter sp. TaxID=191468 RepID=UPI0026095C5A|nr:Hint domain-containing protein [uncultured Sulfitobacter sp.]